MDFVKNYSKEEINEADLRRLLEIARIDREDFFARHKEWARLYKDRIICTALCQGAALHYFGKGDGINDFDVYTFYATNPTKIWYAKRLKNVDFGDSKFGTSSDKPDYIGRRVDLMGRSLDVNINRDPIIAIREYLHSKRTETARLLSEKAVVMLEPVEYLGTVVWPL